MYEIAIRKERTRWNDSYCFVDDAVQLKDVKRYIHYATVWSETREPRACTSSLQLQNLVLLELLSSHRCCTIEFQHAHESNQLIDAKW